MKTHKTEADAPATFRMSHEELEGQNRQAGPDGEVLNAIQAMAEHRNWCKDHSHESDKAMGRFIGADEIWQIFKLRLEPFLRSLHGAQHPPGD